MKNAFVSFCAVLVLSAVAVAQTPTLNALPNTVYVGAEGKFETAPDTALIQFNISAQAESAKDAYDQAAKQAEATRQVSQRSSRCGTIGRRSRAIPASRSGS